MKTREWLKYFDDQGDAGKHLYRLTELANAAGVPRATVNVEMHRLFKHGVVERYAVGLYGLKDKVSAEELVPQLDPYAYITAGYVLMKSGLVTQMPATMTCFTSRRHFKNEINTPVGRFAFVCVKPPIYNLTPGGMACPEQALCDFVYISLRRGTNPMSMVTFRRTEQMNRTVLARYLRRYPRTVTDVITRLWKSVDVVCR